MKSQIKLLGSGHGKGAFGPILSVKPSEARWSCRNLTVYGPVPNELKQCSGSTTADGWLEYLVSGNDKLLDHGPFLDPPNRLAWDSVVMPPRAAQALQRCLSVMGKDSPRNYAQVVNFQTGDFAATDGFRLYQEREFPMLPRGISIPREAAKFLAKAIKGQETSWMVSIDGCILCVAWGSWQVFVKLSAVKFPDYRMVIPKVDKLYQPLDLDAAHTARSYADSIVKAFAKGQKDDDGNIYWVRLKTDAGEICVNPRFFLDGCAMKPDWHISRHDLESPVVGKVGETGTYILVPVITQDKRKRA